MKKTKLTFKVDGGLERISGLYATAENNREAVEAYWQNPGALLEAIAVTPAREIRISAGYKKIADTMADINFGEWHDTFEPIRDKTNTSLQKKAFTSLWHAVNGYPALQAGKLNDAFENPTNSSMMMMMMTVTSTSTVSMMMVVTYGYTDIKEQPPSRVPVPGGPKFASRSELAYMSRYAQTIAEQVGWFS